MSERSFYDEIKQSPVDINRAALSFAKAIAYPELDVDLYVNLIEGLGNWAIKTVTQVHTPRALAEELSLFLFDQLGFQGNAQEYDDPRNSYLNEVFDRRLGIPITLSAIYISVAQKAGLKAEAIGLPGHFIVSIHDSEGNFFVDPFNSGKILSVEECAQLVASTTGYQGPFQESWLEPATSQAILTRMLNNLRNVYMKERNWDYALKVIQHISLLQPDMHELLRDMGFIYHQMGKLKLAIQHYEKYLALSPGASDTQAVMDQLRAAAKTISRNN
jgi:regulator of sirC expression with transglutaminase-like and TPR domain